MRMLEKAANARVTLLGPDGAREGAGGAAESRKSRLSAWRQESFPPKLTNLFTKSANSTISTYSDYFNF